jgi:hypothetical protein
MQDDRNLRYYVVAHLMTALVPVLSPDWNNSKQANRLPIHQQKADMMWTERNEYTRKTISHVKTAPFPSLAA